jgi:hypothetical protein
MIRVAEKMVIREKGEQHMQPAVHWCLCESANKDLSVSEVCGCPKLAVVLFVSFGFEVGNAQDDYRLRAKRQQKHTFYLSSYMGPGTVEAFPVLENVIS